MNDYINESQSCFQQINQDSESYILWNSITVVCGPWLVQLDWWGTQPSLKFEREEAW